MWLPPVQASLWTAQILEPVSWFGKGPRTPGAVGPEGGDPPLATAKFWSVAARYPTEWFLLGVGSHTYPPCKKGVSVCMVFGVPFSCGYLTLEIIQFIELS